MQEVCKLLGTSSSSEELLSAVKNLEAGLEEKLKEKPLRKILRGERQLRKEELPPTRQPEATKPETPSKIFVFTAPQPEISKTEPAPRRILKGKRQIEKRDIQLETSKNKGTAESENKRVVENQGVSEAKNEGSIKDQAQVKLRELIKTAYDVEGEEGKSYLKESLAQSTTAFGNIPVLGRLAGKPEDSKQNKLLLDLSVKNYSQVSVEEMKRDIDAAIETIQSGFQQPYYGEENAMEVPENIQSLITKLQNLKSQF
jgi:hypothetical protein